MNHYLNFYVKGGKRYVLLYLPRFSKSRPRRIAHPSQIAIHNHSVVLQSTYFKKTSFVQGIQQISDSFPCLSYILIHFITFISTMSSAQENPYTIIYFISFISTMSSAQENPYTIIICSLPTKPSLFTSIVDISNFLINTILTISNNQSGLKLIISYSVRKDPRHNVSLLLAADVDQLTFQCTVVYM
jgi:hypothetical protein